MRTLLIVSGGAEGAELAEQAKRLGCYVVVSDRDFQAPAFAGADSCLIADASVPDDTAAAAERFSRKIRKIDGVIGAGAYTVSVGAVAERLGLAGISRDLAIQDGDRLATKKSLLAGRAPVPWFSAVATAQALQRIAIERGPDLVIKPVDRHCGLAAQHIRATSELEHAFALARQHSPTERVMVEEYLEGPQVTAVAIVLNGACHVPVLIDRNAGEGASGAPFLLDGGCELPSQLPKRIQSRTREVTTQAAAALGLDNGVFTFGFAIPSGEPHVVGVMVGATRRSRLIGLCTGIDVSGIAIRLAIKSPVVPEELQPKSLTPVVECYAPAKPGRVVQILGAEQAKAVDGIESITLAHSGDVIRPEFGTPASATVIAADTSREKAVAAARAALARLQIETA